MSATMGPSIQLYSGKWFHFQSFDHRDIVITDIAHALSLICRFTGHCKSFYSVAQHSVIVSHIVPPEYALAGLLHDSTEAYINDLSRPLKLIVPAYGEFEHTRLWPAIAARFDLPDVLPTCVKEADNVALVTERRDLMPAPTDLSTDEWAWAADIEPLLLTIRPWSPERAEYEFMKRYDELTKEKA